MGELKKDGIRAVMSEAAERETLKSMVSRNQQDVQGEAETVLLDRNDVLDAVALFCAPIRAIPTRAAAPPGDAPTLSQLLADDRVKKCMHGVPEGLSCAICGPIRNDDLPVCVKCKHFDATDPRGRCVSVYRDAAGSLVYCGCKCEFSTSPVATTAGEDGPSNPARLAAEEICSTFSLRMPARAGDRERAIVIDYIAGIITKHCGGSE